MPVLLELRIEGEIYEMPDQEAHDHEYPLACFAYGDPAENEPYDLYYPKKIHPRHLGMLEICTLKHIPMQPMVRIITREDGAIVESLSPALVIKTEELKDGFYFRLRLSDIRRVSYRKGGIK